MEYSALVSHWVINGYAMMHTSQSYHCVSQFLHRSHACMDRTVAGISVWTQRWDGFSPQVREPLTTSRSAPTPWLRGPGWTRSPALDGSFCLNTDHKLHRTCDFLWGMWNRRAAALPSSWPWGDEGLTEEGRQHYQGHHIFSRGRARASYPSGTAKPAPDMCQLCGLPILASLTFLF